MLQVVESLPESNIALETLQNFLSQWQHWLLDETKLLLQSLTQRDLTSEVLSIHVDWILKTY